MTFPSPKELGLPAKYVAYRPKQLAAIEDTHGSTKRVKVVVLKGGEGKTLFYILRAMLRPKDRFMIVTPNKGLQDQLVEDFGCVGLESIKGRANYDCEGPGYEGYTCEEGASSKCLYRGSAMCPHFLHKQLVTEARIGITNYSCWIAANRYGQGFGPYDGLILDEAHHAPVEVARAMHIVLTDHEICMELGRTWPDHRSTLDMEAWKHWAQVLGVTVTEELQRLKIQIQQSSGKPKPATVKRLRSLKNTSRKLADIATCKVDRWIADDHPHGFQFDPLDSGEYTEKLLLAGIPDVLATSGTIQSKTLTHLNLTRSDYSIHEYESDVNPDRTPLFYLPTMKVTKTAHEWELKKYLLPVIDRIIEGRLDRKGIIHTGNFKLRDFIMQHSRFGMNGKRILHSNWVKNGDITGDVIARFKKVKPPAALVSPSITTGYDFPYDACRYQIMAKCPLPNIYASKVEIARSEDDPERSFYSCMQSISQAFSRGDRAEDDWQEFFMLDAVFEWLMSRYSHLGAPWLSAFIVNVEDVPPAMEWSVA